MLANKTFNCKKAERAMAAAVVAMAAIVVPGVVSTNLVSSAMADAAVADASTQHAATPNAATPNAATPNAATPNAATPNESTQHVLNSPVSTLEDWQKLMPLSGNLLTAENLAKAPERFDAHQSIIIKIVDTAAGKVVLQKWVPPSDAIFDSADACMRNHQYQQALSKYIQAWQKVFSRNDIINSIEVKEENQGVVNQLKLEAEMNNSSKVSGLGRIGG